MDQGTPRIGLLLGAGGARGWAHIGVLKALDGHGIKPDVICGCSIGALVGASYVTKHLDSLETLARSLTTSRVLRYFDVSLRGGGLIEGRWVVEFLRENVDDTAIENASAIYGAVATDLASGRETWLTSGSIIDAVRASIAVPGLLTPIQIRGRWHVDGAVVNPLPVSLCRALGADVIIGVNLNGTLMGRPDIMTASGGELAEQPVASSSGTSSWLEWMGYGRGAGTAPSTLESTAAKRPSYHEVVSQTFFLVQDFVSRVRLAADPVDLLITPDTTNIAWLEFNRATEAIEAGENAVHSALPAIKSAIGTPEVNCESGGDVVD